MLNRPVPEGSKRRILGLVAVVAGIILLPMGSNIIAEAANAQENFREYSKTNAIVPGVGVGAYKLGMSKDEVLKRLGKAEAGNSISADGIILNIVDDTVNSIDVVSPVYKFANGLGIGSSEQKMKQTFGDDFLLKETEWKDYLVYENEGLQFEIYKKNRTIMEFTVYQTTSDHGDVRKQRQMRSLPKYNPDSTNPFQVDLRNYDLTNLDLSNSIYNLLHATFDDRTIWPALNQMPPRFDWQRIMELGKNPGLGIRSLHNKGITGRGVGIAIIDQPLLVEHQEYADRLRLYEEIHIQSGMGPQMHGPAVASIA